MRRESSILIFAYISLFLIGIAALFHGLPDIERFFAEWMDEKLTLTSIMKIGALNFKPPQAFHPPLYHYLTFVPIALFYLIGKVSGLFATQLDFVRFYSYHTEYFFLIGRAMSYVFFWFSAAMIYKIIKLFYSKTVSHLSVFAFLLTPALIIDSSTTRVDTLLILSTLIFFYFFFKFYSQKYEMRYLYISAFFLGVSAASKYNAVFLLVYFVPLVYFLAKDKIIRGLSAFAALFLKLGVFFILGNFICNPFFFLNFKTYGHNLVAFQQELRYYWGDYAPSVFILTHLRELASFLYLNLLGLVILFLGAVTLYKRNRRLCILLFSGMLVFEAYFSITLPNCFPLRYTYPLLGAAVIFFASGVEFILSKHTRLKILVVIFFVLIGYNYFDIWREFSSGPTQAQEARRYIESNIPALSAICIVPNQHLPQLNMTRESYWRLIQTAPVLETRGGQPINYVIIEDKHMYNDKIQEIWIESLTQYPQYDLYRWDRNIESMEQAEAFFKKNNIKYVLALTPVILGNRSLEESGGLSLLKAFKAKKARVYNAVSLLLYRVNS